MKRKNQAAVALAKRKWSLISAKKRSEMASEMASQITPESAKARTAKAVETRKKNAAKKISTLRNTAKNNKIGK